ncbi:MAG: DUF2249 domain-containing protein [Agrobacterium tumefaciens]
MSKGKEDGLSRFCLSQHNEAFAPILQFSAVRPAAYDLETSIKEGPRMTVAVEDHVLKLDVREIPRVERHPRIFGMLNSLLPDYQLILTVDHDPVPLYYHLETHYDGMFGWEYLSRGPEIWEVRIRRKKHEGCNCNCGGGH